MPGLKTQLNDFAINTNPGFIVMPAEIEAKKKDSFVEISKHIMHLLKAFDDLKPLQDETNSLHLKNCELIWVENDRIHTPILLLGASKPSYVPIATDVKETYFDIVRARQCSVILNPADHIFKQLLDSIGIQERNLLVDYRCKVIKQAHSFYPPSATPSSVTASSESSPVTYRGAGATAFDQSSRNRISGPGWGQSGGPDSTLG